MGKLTRADSELYYEISGSGAPVLFIQGVGVTGEGWRLQIRDLEKHFQTLIFDNRGFGRSVPCRGPITIESMAEDARALMDNAGWSSAHVVGHSMGGVIAQQLALACPRRVRSLSLLCTFARGKDAMQLNPYILWMTLRTRIGSRAARRRAFLEMLFPEEHLQTADLAQLASDVGTIIGRDLADQPAVMMKQVMALGRHDVSARLRELAHTPAWVLSGPHDRIAQPSSGRRLAELIPGASYEEIPESSHGVILHKPTPVNQRLRRFFEMIESRTESRDSHVLFS
jgi:pimeloyl-ACP methyl ester carboxylesterase